MTLNQALNLKTEKRMAAIDIAEGKRNELHLRIPRIAEIDKLVRSIPLRMLGGEDVQALKEESKLLRAERARLLEAYGYGADYDEPAFECKLCNDGGYVGLKLCGCIRALVAESKYTESRLAGGLINKTFDTFSLSYYEGEERKKMESILKGCKNYADSFPKASYSGLMFLGGTGLGKTHLSAAIANVVAGKGMSVVYESAQQIYDTVDAVRFNRMELSERTKYETCQLLIIDDLGAECITQYSVAALTSLIDLRIVNGRQTIISTNLSLNAIKKTYGERLYSRLLGEFLVLPFVGKDIRMQKLNEKR